MATFELSRKIQTTDATNVQSLMNYFEKQLILHGNADCINRSDRSRQFRGKIKEGLFTLMVKYDLTIDIRSESDRARIHVVGKSQPNAVFWIFIIVGLFTGFFIFIAILLYLLQRNKPREAAEQILNAMETEFGRF